jgi:hypothetical protein
MESGCSFISEATNISILLGIVQDSVHWLVVADLNQEGERLYISIRQTCRNR